MNIEDIKNVILEAFGEVREEKETADSPDTHKITDLPKSLQKSITARYGVGKYPERDFLSSDMKTLFRTISVDKNTGSVGHKIISLPSFNGLYKDYSDIIADLKELMRSPDIQRDQKAKDLFELIRTNFRKLQSYLRTERPEQYELMRMRRSMEEAVTGLKRLKYDNLNEAKKDIYDKFLDNPSSPKGRAKSLILKFTKEYGDGASSMAVDRFASKYNLKPEEKYILKYITKNDIKISSQSGGPDFSAVSEAAYLKELEKEEPAPEEPADMDAPKETVLEDATDTILGKFPTLSKAIIKLQTKQFKEFVDTVDWVSPRPSSFRVNLKNGQHYILKWTGTGFEAQIMGKRYYIDKIDDYQQALDKMTRLYQEGPMSGAGEAEAEDTGGGGGGGGDFPGGEGGAEGGEEGEAGAEIPAGDDAPAEPADLGGEEIDFEDGAEPEA
jgi:hypothetical protein